VLKNKMAIKSMLRNS